jgi:hypothetical protein
MRDPAIPGSPTFRLYRPSRTLVFGWRFAEASVMNRPLIAERLPCAWLGTVWLIVVFGWRAAVAEDTNLPVPADRLTLAIAHSF